jgi:hypothetical protein
MARIKTIQRQRGGTVGRGRRGGTRGRGRGAGWEHEDTHNRRRHTSLPPLPLPPTVMPPPTSRGELTGHPPLLRAISRVSYVEAQLPPPMPVDISEHLHTETPAASFLVNNQSAFPYDNLSNDDDFFFGQSDDDVNVDVDCAIVLIGYNSMEHERWNVEKLSNAIGLGSNSGISLSNGNLQPRTAAVINSGSSSFPMSSPLHDSPTTTILHLYLMFLSSYSLIPSHYF